MKEVEEYTYIIKALTEVEENSKEYQELKKQQQELKLYILSHE